MLPNRRLLRANCKSESLGVRKLIGMWLLARSSSQKERVLTAFVAGVVLLVAVMAIWDLKPHAGTSIKNGETIDPNMIPLVTGDEPFLSSSYERVARSVIEFPVLSGRMAKWVHHLSWLKQGHCVLPILTIEVRRRR